MPKFYGPSWLHKNVSLLLPLLKRNLVPDAYSFVTDKLSRSRMFKYGKCSASEYGSGNHSFTQPYSVVLALIWCKL